MHHLRLIIILSVLFSGIICAQDLKQDLLSHSINILNTYSMNEEKTNELILSLINDSSFSESVFILDEWPIFKEMDYQTKGAKVYGHSDFFYLEQRLKNLDSLKYKFLVDSVLKDPSTKAQFFYNTANDSVSKVAVNYIIKAFKFDSYDSLNLMAYYGDSIQKKQNTLDNFTNNQAHVIYVIPYSNHNQASFNSILNNKNYNVVSFIAPLVHLDIDDPLFKEVKIRTGIKETDLLNNKLIDYSKKLRLHYELYFKSNKNIGSIKLFCLKDLKFNKASALSYFR